MPWQTLLFDIIVLSIFGAAVYSFLILPRRRDFRKRQAFVGQLEPGMEVTTYGGIIGKVTKVEHDLGLVWLEIAPGVEVRFIGAAIMGEFDTEALEESVRKALAERVA